MSELEMMYEDAYDHMTRADEQRCKKLIDEHDMLADQAESLEAVIEEQSYFYSNCASMCVPEYNNSPIIGYDRSIIFRALESALEALKEAMAVIDGEVRPILEDGEARRIAQWERDKAHGEAEYREMQYAQGA